MGIGGSLCCDKGECFEMNYVSADEDQAASYISHERGRWGAKEVCRTGRWQSGGCWCGRDKKLLPRGKKSVYT